MLIDLDRRDRFEAVAGSVYEPLQRYLRRRCAPDDAADLLSEALLTIWRRLDDVPADDPLPWCYGVARRCLANQRRGARRRLRLVDRVRSQPAVGATDDGGYDTIDHDLDPDLAAALATLADLDRELIRLWAWEQLEPREIAAVVDLTANAVSLRLSRSRKRLARALADAGHERRGRPGPGRQNGTDAGHEETRHTEGRRP